MKILILGSKGNLGTQLVKTFGDGHEVIALNKEDIDATQEREIVGKLEKAKPDVVINAVAYNAVDKCENDGSSYDLAYRLNVLTVKYLSNICLQLNATLVHYSSDYVFSGNKEKQSFEETDEPNPINQYGKTKYLGEQELIRAGKQGLKYYLIRTSKLFGPKGSSELTKPSFFDIILRSAEENNEVNIVDEELSCFTYTVDLAKATKEIIEDKLEYGIYHVVNSDPVTWYESVIELFKLKGINVKINPVKGSEFKRPAARPMYSALKNTKLKELRSWKLALKEYLDSI